MRCYLGAAFSLTLCSPASAQFAWDLELAGEARWFPEAIHSEGYSGSTLATFQGRTTLTESVQLTAEIFGRLDESDSGRSHIDLREFWINTNVKGFDVGVGAAQEFWGVTESHHLVNVLNQNDLTEDIDREDFLGQPMLKLARQWPSMELAAYVLPYFRTRPSHNRGRPLSLRTPLTPAEYTSGAEQWHVDVAARWSAYTDNLDIGVAYFEGTDRDPVLTASASTAPPSLTPTYHQIKQFSVDAQITTGPWLLKLEAIRRDGYADTIKAWVLGVEYTIFQLARSSWDLGLIAERIADDRDEVDVPATLFDDELFLGVRLGFNNQADSSLLLGGYLDRQTKEAIYRAEFSHRINRVFSLSLTATTFSANKADQSLSMLRNDDFISLTLSAHFGGRW